MSLSNASITSDIDYLKIQSDGLLNITTSPTLDPDFTFPTDPFAQAGTASEQGVATITHGLGSVPLVRAFIDPGANGLWYGCQAQIGYVTIDPDLLTLVDTNILKLCVNASAHKANIPVWYRIYKTSNQAISSADRIDKIFSKGNTSLSFAGPANSSDNVQQVVTIPHNQGEAIAWTMQFSQDGVNWYNDANFIYGPPDTNSGPPGGPYSYYYYQRAYASADNTNFYLRFEHNYNSVRTFYARWALDYRT